MTLRSMAAAQATTGMLNSSPERKEAAGRNTKWKLGEPTPTPFRKQAMTTAGSFSFFHRPPKAANHNIDPINFSLPPQPEASGTYRFGNFPFSALSTICFTSSEKSFVFIHSKKLGSSLATSLSERPLYLPNVNVASLFRHSNFRSESTKRSSRWLQKP